ncbi:hypothetical protein IC762_25215 [Bradyrhizobium genosp. L]|uniref:hypothetical protein n=1 Tax=Bradyrhizobium genosp. L TaxID=83637 RepID=UPI0018A2C0F2|nr:hypothetical protein [Bradyrhizobium genosp. L]QPF83020.1 hypothetical protein IC762_25215 [Bradyrhizobium genosp. L]
MSKVVPPVALLLALASPAIAVPSRPRVELCADVKDAVAKDDALRGAMVAAFGDDVHFRSADAAGQGHAPACERLAALLHFSRADVLVTARDSAGKAAHGEGARLSSYVLRKSGGVLRLVTVRRDFAEANAAWGNAGRIVQARFADDDGMIVSGSETAQGYTDGAASLYAFRSGGIVPLGTIPTEWDNGGAEEDDGKVVTIKATIASEQLETDRVHVIYTRKAAGTSQTQETIWRTRNGKFALESGRLPEEIAADFKVSSSPTVDGSSPPAAADGGQSGPILTIEDRELAPVPSDVSKAVKHDPAYADSCKLIGRPILPSIGAALRTYFVTTADACGWGSAVGPIWIVAVTNTGQAHTVLSTGGYSVKIVDAVRNGFHDLAVGTATASTETADDYSYDGQAYRKSHS